MVALGPAGDLTAGQERAVYVAVVGSGTAAGDLYEQAREVGRFVAERGEGSSSAAGSQA